MKDEKVKLLTPPMCFWDKITDTEWKKLSEDEQEAFIKSATVILKLRTDEAT